MARGMIYHITKQREDLGLMSEDDFYGMTGALGCDYVEDCKDASARNALERLHMALWDAGMKVHCTGMERCWFSFHTPADISRAKSVYFEEKFKKMKQMADAITPEQFSSDSSEVYRLRMVIEDTFGDMVWDGYELHTADRFIRKLEPDTVYYVADNTVYMH